MYTSNLYALKNAVNLRKKSKHIITKELLNKTWESENNTPQEINLKQAVKTKIKLRQGGIDVNYFH